MNHTDEPNQTSKPTNNFFFLSIYNVFFQSNLLEDISHKLKRNNTIIKKTHLAIYNVVMSYETIKVPPTNLAKSRSEGTNTQNTGSFMLICKFWQNDAISKDSTTFSKDYYQVNRKFSVYKKQLSLFSQLFWVGYMNQKDKFL